MHALSFLAATFGAASRGGAFLIPPTLSCTLNMIAIEGSPIASHTAFVRHPALQFTSTL